MTPVYDPNANFEIRIWEEDFKDRSPHANAPRPYLSTGR